jgi:ferredoxin
MGEGASRRHRCGLKRTLKLVYARAEGTDFMLTSKSLKEFLKNRGADLVGIGSVDRWDSAPAENDPRAIMPYAKSVICIGFRVHRGSHRGIAEGTYYSSYTLTGFADLNNVIAPMLQRAAADFIEDYGFEAATVMYHANRFGGGRYHTGRPALRLDGSEKPCPDIYFDFRIGAVLCGMGQIGHNRLLLTPKFGPSQRVYFIVTDAPLDADPIAAPSICDACMECVRKCPAKALSSANFDDVDVTDVALIHRSALDVGKCSVAHYGGCSPFAPTEVSEYAQNIIEGTASRTADGRERPTDDAIVAYLRENIPYTKYAYDFTYGPAAVCGACMRSCLAHLDGTGRLPMICIP